MTKKTSLCQGDTNRRRRGARGDPRLKGQGKMARRVFGYGTTELTRSRSQILGQFESEVTPHKTLGHELPVLIIEAEEDVDRLTRGVSAEMNPQPPDQLACPLKIKGVLPRDEGKGSPRDEQISHRDSVSQKPRIIKGPFSQPDVSASSPQRDNIRPRETGIRLMKLRRSSRMLRPRKLPWT
jgi:hypothetical protein